MPLPLPTNWFMTTNPKAIDSFIDAFCLARWGTIEPKVDVVGHFDSASKIAGSYALLVDGTDYALEYPPPDERKHRGHPLARKPLYNPFGGKNWDIMSDTLPDLIASITAYPIMPHEQHHSWSAQIRCGSYAQFITAYSVPGSDFENADKFLLAAAMEIFAIAERVIPLQYRLEERFGTRKESPEWNLDLIDEIATGEVAVRKDPD